jgi:hypothetical protein
VLKMSSPDKRKYKPLRNLTKVKNLVIWLKNGVRPATIYDIRKDREKIGCFVKNTDRGPSDRQTLNIELMDTYSQSHLCT